MSRLRSSIVLLALAAAFGVGVPCASAVDPFPTSGIATLHSEHFQVHWNRNDQSITCPEAFITQEQAGDILGWAERAYGLYSQWNYTPPTLDSDGNTYYDISVDQLTSIGSSCVSYNVIDPSVPVDDNGTYKRWDSIINPDVANPTGDTAFIHLDSKKGINFHVVAHAVFHLFELKADKDAQPWLQEGSAEWAAFRAEDFLTPNDPDLGANPDRTADCVGAECGDTELDKNGYPGWLLFEFLSEEYGQDAVRQLWAEPGHGIDKFAAFLPSTRPVDTFYNDFATRRLTGGLTLDAIAGKLPPAQTSVVAPDVTGELPTTYLAVNHLAARYMTIQHDNPANVRAPCYAATLVLTITIPAGTPTTTPIPSVPYYYPNTYGSDARPFTLSVDAAGKTIASLAVTDWNTCAASPDAWISLPNDSWNPGLDGREFKIEGFVSVNLNEPASPAAPSTSVITVPAVPAPTSEPAPTLKLYAPEVLRVSSKTRLLRFVIFSSGSGRLRARLGSSDLGSVGLRAGTNDIRFTLPASLVTALRKTSARSLLALTSLSPTGRSGATITRGVLIQTPKKKKTTKRR